MRGTGRAQARAQDTTGNLVRGASTQDALFGRPRTRLWCSPAAAWSRAGGFLEPFEEAEPGDVPGHVACFGQVVELAGRLPVHGHGVVVGVLPEQGLQCRCDVGAVLDQALLACVGLADFALGAVAAEE